MAGKRAEGDGGMVSASQPDAAAAGAAILRQGGNAMDAAVATAFALSVTDISQTGLGGGGALTWYDATAHRAEHLSFYARTGADSLWAVEDTTLDAATDAARGAATPGMVAGLLEAHARFGRLPREAVLAPAIVLARDGFIVTPLLARTIASARARLGRDSAATARFLPGGEPLQPGDRLVQPELAKTLGRIAVEGASAFYRGPLAAELVAAVRRRGGLIQLADLAAYPVTATRPICAEWRGFTVLSAPPPMGGTSVLSILQQSERGGVTREGGLTDRPAAVVALADILRLVGADAVTWRGDPAVMPVPARGVSGPSYAAERARLVGAPVTDTIRPGAPWAHEDTAPTAHCAADPYPPSALRPQPADSAVGAARGAAPPGDDRHQDGGSFTSHLAVVDAEGNAVSATTTVGVLFGSGIYTGGFFLNSSGGNMDERTRGTNRYANSTIAPTLILDGDAVRLVIGAAGSLYIQPAIAQVTMRILAFGEDAGLAIAAPRIQASPFRRDVEVEPGFTSDVYAALIARGYRTTTRVADLTFGAVHAIEVRPDGRRVGVADPRRDGAVAVP